MNFCFPDSSRKANPESKFLQLTVSLVEIQTATRRVLLLLRGIVVTSTTGLLVAGARRVEEGTLGGRGHLYGGRRRWRDETIRCRRQQRPRVSVMGWQTSSKLFDFVQQVFDLEHENGRNLSFCFSSVSLEDPDEFQLFWMWSFKSSIKINFEVNTIPTLIE